MKIKDGFVLRKIAGEDIAVPIGNNIADFNGVIKLNESAAFLWAVLQNDITREELTAKLMTEFDIDQSLADKDVDKFLTILIDKKIIEGV